MAGEHRSLVEQIQAFLSVPNRPVDAKTQEVASSFATLCDKTNRRLERCRTLLGQNLRSAAIAVAEADPSLFELVPETSFDEFELWEAKAIESQGTEAPLETPQRILNLIFEDLDEAYAAELKVRPLMKQHRRLVLMGAPLSERITLMRSLVELDDERAWRDDLEEYENARLASIEDEGRACVKAGDAKTLTRLHQELASPDWTVPVPDALKRKIGRAMAKLKEAGAIQQLEQLADQVRAAVEANDSDELVRIRTEWIAVEATVQGTPEHLQRLNEKFSAVWEYVEGILQERQGNALREQAHAALLTAVRSPAKQTLDSLNKVYRQATDAGLEIDPALLMEYQTAVAAVQATRRRRTVIGSAIAVALIATLAVGGWLTYSSHIANQALQVAVTQINGLVEAEDHEPARKQLTGFLDTYPAFAEDDQISILDNQITLLESEEQDRAEAFEETVQVIERQITLGNNPEKLIALLEKSQRSDADRMTIQRLRTDFELETERALDDATKEAKNRFSTADALLESAQAAVGDYNFQMAEEDLESATAELTDIPRLDELPDDVKTGHEALQRRIQAITQSIAAERERENLLSDVARLASAAVANWPNSDANAYSRAIQKYRTADTEGRVDIEAHPEFWSRLTDWDFATRRWSTNGVFPKLAKDARGRKTAMSKLTLRGRPERQQLSDLITEIDKRELNGGFSSTRTKITDVMKQPWLSGSRVLVGPEKPQQGFGAYARFIVPATSKPATRSKKYEFEFLRTPNKRSKLVLEKGLWKPALRETVASQVAKRCIARIDKVAATFDYERSIIDVVNLLIAESELRPELRFVAIHQVLEKSADGSPFLRKHTHEILEIAYRKSELAPEIRRQQHKMAGWIRDWEIGSWIAPDAEKLTPIKPWHEPCLALIAAEIQKVLPAVRKDIEEFSHQIMRSHSAIGYVWTDGGFELSRQPERPEAVYALNSHGNLRRIGEVAGGAVNIDPGAGKLNTGQLLFVEQAVKFDNSWVDQQLGVGLPQ